MIPTLLLLGLVTAFVPRGWMIVALASTAASVFITMGDTTSDSGNGVWFPVLVFAIFAANGAVGMMVGRAIKWTFYRVTNQAHS